MDEVISVEISNLVAIVKQIEDFNTFKHEGELIEEKHIVLYDKDDRDRLLYLLECLSEEIKSIIKQIKEENG